MIYSVEIHTDTPSIANKIKDQLGIALGFELSLVLAEVSQDQLRTISDIDGVREVRIIKDYKHKILRSMVSSGAVVARREGYTGKGTAIAILDTACNTTHSDFYAFGANPIISYLELGATPTLELDHGTNIASIINAVAPDTKIFYFNVFGTDGYVDIFALQDSYIWIDTYNQNPASEYFIEFLNLSLGGTTQYATIGGACDSEVLAQFANIGASKGFWSVIASGNEAHQGSVGEPACATFGISVGATYSGNFGSVAAVGEGQNMIDVVTNDKTVTYFSDIYSDLHFFAPGAFITAGGYRLVGTSMAAPHVVGALAVMREKFPSATVPELIDILRITGTTVTRYRHGMASVSAPLINIGAAVAYAQ